MEYSQTYQINRKMHARPCMDVVNECIWLRGKYSGLRIKPEEPETKECLETESIITPMGQSGLFHMGGQVRITVGGRYPIEILQQSADQIGGIFSTKDTSRTTWEILYRSQYGHYPDEVPQQETQQPQPEF